MACEADLDLISQTLEGLRRLQRSSPSGIHWDSVFRAIVKDYPRRNWPPLPLILGGAMASDADKHERLRIQLVWAADHGRLKEALNALSAVPADGWNEHPIELWNEKFSWSDEDDVEADK